MKGYKDPGFQDRIGNAAKAKQKALERLKAKAPVDPSVLAERAAAREAREARAAEARAEKQRVLAEKAAAEEARKAEAAAKVPTEAEKKAARDARYAARKNRK